MIINVGSQNQTKIDAVNDAILLYPSLFTKPIIKGIDVELEEFGHPKNIEQTVDGAIKRAKLAYNKCDLSIGIEGGLIEICLTPKRYLEISIAAIFDGEQIYIGAGPAFEWPAKVLELILGGEADASKAFHQLGLTDSVKLGAEAWGISGFLTNGRLTRESQIQQSIIAALIYLEKKELA